MIRTPRLARFPFLLVVLLAAAIGHGAFAWANRERRPEMTILDPPPSAAARDMLSFGDAQFLYRIWSAQLQNAGDTGGRATRMRDYNYDNVIAWLHTLEALDRDSQQYVFLAAHHFALTPELANVRRVVEFINADVALSPARKWYWLTYTMVLAQKNLNDLPFALSIARQLAAYDFPDMSGWNYMFPTIFLERLKRYDEAREELAAVLVTKKDRLAPEHFAWAEDFTHGLAQSPR